MTEVKRFKVGDHVNVRASHHGYDRGIIVGFQSGTDLILVEFINGTTEWFRAKDLS